MNYTGYGIPNGRKDIVDDEVADLDYQSNLSIRVVPGCVPPWKTSG
jgi:hypothetical protein